MHMSDLAIDRIKELQELVDEDECDRSALEAALTRAEQEWNTTVDNHGAVLRSRGVWLVRSDKMMLPDVGLRVE